jgi:hypothetical protein
MDDPGARTGDLPAGMFRISNPRLAAFQRVYEGGALLQDESVLG